MPRFQYGDEVYSLSCIRDTGWSPVMFVQTNEPQRISDSTTWLVSEIRPDEYPRGKLKFWYPESDLTAENAMPDILLMPED